MCRILPPGFLPNNKHKFSPEDVEDELSLQITSKIFVNSTENFTHKSAPNLTQTDHSSPLPQATHNSD